MNFQSVIIVLSALFFTGVLTNLQAYAASANAAATATIISTTNVAIVAAAELLQSASTGVLTLSIPGTGASGVYTGGSGGGMTLTSTGVAGNTIIFSTTDSAPLSSLLQSLAASGGSLGVKGILSSGQGVSLSVTNAVQSGDGRGTVYAIVAYN